MAEQVTKLRAFVASPGDVLDERERLKLVVDELDRTLADSLGHSLELLDWRDVVPSMGRPEQVILDQLKLDAWDIFVGILWTRFGTPSGAIRPDTGEPFLSGTEEEFLTNIIDKVEAHVDPSANPMQAVAGIMQSGTRFFGSKETLCQTGTIFQAHCIVS